VNKGAKIRERKGLVEGGNEVNKNAFLRKAGEENLSDVEPLRQDNGQILTEMS
jgi:hypothetical protein